MRPSLAALPDGEPVLGFSEHQPFMERIFALEGSGRFLRRGNHPVATNYSYCFSPPSGWIRQAAMNGASFTFVMAGGTIIQKLKASPVNRSGHLIASGAPNCL